jgi:hypothetical protein
VNDKASILCAPSLISRALHCTVYDEYTSTVVVFTAYNWNDDTAWPIRVLCLVVEEVTGLTLYTVPNKNIEGALRALRLVTFSPGFILFYYFTSVALIQLRHFSCLLQAGRLLTAPQSLKSIRVRPDVKNATSKVHCKQSHKLTLIENFECQTLSSVRYLHAFFPIKVLTSSYGVALQSNGLQMMLSRHLILMWQLWLQICTALRDDEKGLYQFGNSFSRFNARASHVPLWKFRNHLSRAPRGVLNLGAAKAF